MSRRSWLLVGALFVLANLALRLPGLLQELPPFSFCDEDLFLGPAHKMLATGDQDIKQFLSGALNFRLPLLAGQLWGAVRPSPLPMPELMIASRLLGPGLLSSLAVLLLMLAVRRLDDDARPFTTLLAGLCFTFSPLVLMNSRMTYPDHYIVFFSAAALLCSVHVLRGPADRALPYVLGGLSIGLAASVKYNGVLLALPLAAAHVLRTIDPQRPRVRLPALLRDHALLAEAALITIVTFVVVNRTMFDHFPTFLADLRWNHKQYVEGHMGLEAPNAPFFYLKVLLGTTFGVLGVVALALGLHDGWRTRFREALLFLVLPLGLIGSMASYKVATARNMMLAVPFVLAPMAFGIAFVARKLAVRWPRAAWGLAFLPFALEPVGKTLYSFAHDLRRDARLTAREWMAETIPREVPLGGTRGCFFTVVDEARHKYVEKAAELAPGRGPCVDHYVHSEWSRSRRFYDQSPWVLFTEPRLSSLLYLNPGGIALSQGGRRAARLLRRLRAPQVLPRLRPRRHGLQAARALRDEMTTGPTPGDVGYGRVMGSRLLAP